MDPHTGGTTGTAGPRWLARLDAMLGWMVEMPAALLVLADIVVLFSGVVSRYVLHKPLLWSDELASILFLWLAMLGSVIALRRGEHMRMTALVSKAGPHRRALLELVGIAACLAFLAMVLGLHGNTRPTRKPLPRLHWKYPTSGVRQPCLWVSR